MKYKEISFLQPNGKMYLEKEPYEPSHIEIDGNMVYTQYRPSSTPNNHEFFIYSMSFDTLTKKSYTNCVKGSYTYTSPRISLECDVKNNEYSIEFINIYPYKYTKLLYYTYDKAEKKEILDLRVVNDNIRLLRENKKIYGEVHSAEYLENTYDLTESRLKYLFSYSYNLYELYKQITEEQKEVCLKMLG